MPDREKVIKGLEYCTLQARKGWPYEPEITKSGCEIYACPYINNCGEMLFDALALIAENQPEEPREERHESKINHEWGDEVEVWSEFYCSHCGAMIAKGESERYPRCMWCGKAVKWK